MSLTFGMSDILAERAKMQKEKKQGAVAQHPVQAEVIPTCRRKYWDRNFADYFLTEIHPAVLASNR